MAIVGIATGADLHGLEAEGFDLVEHGLERKMIVDRSNTPMGILR